MVGLLIAFGLLIIGFKALFAIVSWPFKKVASVKPDIKIMAARAENAAWHKLDKWNHNISENIK